MHPQRGRTRLALRSGGDAPSQEGEARQCSSPQRGAWRANIAHQSAPHAVHDLRTNSKFLPQCLIVSGYRIFAFLP